MVIAKRKKVGLLSEANEGRSRWPALMIRPVYTCCRPLGKPFAAFCPERVILCLQQMPAWIIMEIVKPSEKDFDALTALWEASVRATHHFLAEADILYFRPLVRHEFLRQVDLYCINETSILGFIGLSGPKIEMLFVDPDILGKGMGKALLQFAIREKGATLVDVNEQNEAAVGFYRHMGFKVMARDEKDALGKPYPVLHMELLPRSSSNT